LIPKKVYISWKDDSVFTDDHCFPRNTVQKLKELSPNWEIEFHADIDVDEYLKQNIDRVDYLMLRNRHIVEKLDVWRLIKLYNEGGIYIDFDRLVNVSLDYIVKEDIRWVLPTCKDNDFSHDFMCSAPGNPAFLETLKMNLSRRKGPYGNNIYYLGPQTYMHGITKTLFGQIMDVNPGQELFHEIRKALDDLSFVSTYREEPPHNLVTYRPEFSQIDFDHEKMKREYYAKNRLQHWTGDW
jgi:mannosyltransferase OCH1-like enzyme